ncbi:glycosyltransferase [Knoellia sinensis]|nr:glycosyltransferase [Knoellia sinensis]
MPTYNRQVLLQQSIESVIAQSHQNWELIVIDDASPVPPVIADDPRIRLIRGESNSGFAACANMGLGLARGRYVTFLADDDMWTRDRLRNALAAHSEADVVWCATIELGARAVSPTKPPSTRPITLNSVNRELPETMGAVSLPREICPLLDPEFRACEDIDWGIRLRREHPNEVHLSSSDFLWRKHNGPRHLNGTEVRIQASEVLLRRHPEFYAQNPAIHAFRWYRIALMQTSMGKHRVAIRSALTSFRVKPSKGAIALIFRLALAQARWPFLR